MNEQLIGLLQDFQEGDLVAAAEIIDVAGTLAGDAAARADHGPVYERIVDAFRSAVTSGDASQIEELRAQWIQDLGEPSSASAGASAPDALAAAVAHISPLADLLARYTGDDLALATEILAESQRLATSDDTPAEDLPAVRRIRDAFFQSVRAGTLGEIATDPEPEPEPERADAPPHEVPVDDLDIVTSFVQESVDHLDDIEHRVLTLEGGHDDDLVNSIFRSIHTIKGVASFVGFSYVSETSHELETLLDDVRNGNHEVNDELITVLLHGTDVLVKIIHGIEAQVAAAGSAPPSSLVEESFGHLGIVARVRELRGAANDDARPPAEGTPQSGAPVAGPVASDGRDVGDAPIVTREMIDAFIEESTDLLDQVEQDLLSAESTPIPPQTVDRIFRSIHTVKGNAGFFWFTRVEQRCMAMEEALDAYRKSGTTMDRETAGKFIDSLDTVRESVRAVETAAASTEPSSGTDRSRPAEGSGDDGSPDIDSPDALGEILVQMGEIDEGSLQRALERQQRRLGEILVTDEHVAPDSVEKALAEQTKRRTTASTTTQEYSSARKDIRVDTTKLDKLFELVGELITAESMVLGGLHNGNGNGTVGHDAASTITKAASYLQKITREMQEITLSIRMIPLEATFGKMRRLVRDLARRFEKNVAIEIAGEDTEMDKNVIEEISDPLVHIIRNAIDHGIETASEREASGKPATGTITLSAKHEGNEIWITIADDGHGLSRERILRKAYERGLVQESDPDLTDEQVYQFVFEPAFSTADQVSEISGRGVGMDVVRQNIEKLRGKIDLRSAPGEGTTFVLRIPLTLAILDGVTFDIAGTQYSVPTTDLVTFEGYDPTLITGTSSDHHGFRLREEVIPIIQFEHRDTIPEHGVIIVLQSNGRQAAIVVDAIVGYRQFVVRAVPSYIKGMRAVSGCSIQGDGSISFIVDVAELMTEELENVGSR